MLIRRNTKQYKAISQTFQALAGRNDRPDHIKLFFVEPGKSVQEKIDIEKLGESGSFYYNLTYDNILNGLENKDMTLYENDSDPGLYFFKDRQRQEWDQTPFRLPQEAVKDAGAFIANLPPDKPGKKPEKATEIRTTKKERGVKKKEQKAEKKEKPKPLFDLKHTIAFTHLDQVITQGVKKKDILDYYFRMSECIIPFIQNRPLVMKDYKTNKEFAANRKKLAPDKSSSWLDTVRVKRSDAELEGKFIRGNDKEHLLWMIERGATPQQAFAARFDNMSKPDFGVLEFAVDGNNRDELVSLAQIVGKILGGCKLSFFFLFPATALQAVIPFNGKGSLKEVEETLGIVLTLIQLKRPEIFPSDGQKRRDQTKRPVRRFFAVPFTLIPVVQKIALPFTYEELSDKAFPFIREFRDKPEPKEAEKRARKINALVKNAVDAAGELKRLKEVYGFLLA